MRRPGREVAHRHGLQVDPEAAVRVLQRHSHVVSAMHIPAACEGSTSMQPLASTGSAKFLIRLVLLIYSNPSSTGNVIRSTPFKRLQACHFRKYRSGNCTEILNEPYRRSPRWISTAELSYGARLLPQIMILSPDREILTSDTFKPGRSTTTTNSVRPRCRSMAGCQLSSCTIWQPCLVISHTHANTSTSRTSTRTSTGTSPQAQAQAQAQAQVQVQCKCDTSAGAHAQVRTWTWTWIWTWAWAWAWSWIAFLHDRRLLCRAHWLTLHWRCGSSSVANSIFIASLIISILHHSLVIYSR
mmetsp:Transcript_36127/g.95123  ORF Transcript_36127/g.95123 Transcript_36127/m.95123 type:complete len:299 (+) Transcript_36127:221-1117(+)